MPELEPEPRSVKSEVSRMNECPSSELDLLTDTSSVSKEHLLDKFTDFAGTWQTYESRAKADDARSAQVTAEPQRAPINPTLSRVEELVCVSKHSEPNHAFGG
ncbi:unnamed protein product [Protopolystoma xenopodis]|uniref:Uncharacterized protein n=1 Tax=Protopolystoma xenopodis TaxID=117903 RepID=A0A448XIY6_9PLAT|nr:unnamed protein product [Protopolystoma xenopodis]